jgi:hypothetical protein
MHKTLKKDYINMGRYFDALSSVYCPFYFKRRRIRNKYTHP